MTSIWPNLVYADYLGSDNVRVFPASTSDIADGYNNGDVVQFIIEAVPRDTGSTEGHAAWSTFYIPPGVTVIGASYIVLDGSGNYVDGPAEDVDATYDGWGVRGAKGYVLVWVKVMLTKFSKILAYSIVQTQEQPWLKQALVWLMPQVFRQA